MARSRFCANRCNQRDKKIKHHIGLGHNRFPILSHQGAQNGFMLLLIFAVKQSGSQYDHMLKVRSNARGKFFETLFGHTIAFFNVGINSFGSGVFNFSTESNWLHPHLYPDAFQRFAVTHSFGNQPGGFLNHVIFRGAVQNPRDDLKVFVADVFKSVNQERGKCRSAYMVSSGSHLCLQFRHTPASVIQ